MGSVSKDKQLTFCGKPVAYFQSTGHLFCQDCLDRTHAGEPVLPCEPLDDLSLREGYAGLFRVARGLISAGVTEEAMIIPTLVFAARSREFPLLEQLQDWFVEAENDKERWEELAGRFGRAFRRFHPERRVSGIWTLYLKDMFLGPQGNPETGVVERIEIEVYRRTAKPDKLAEIYSKLLSKNNVPCDSARGSFSWMIFNGFIRMLVRPEDITVHPLGQYVVQSKAVSRQLSFPQPRMVRDCYASLFGSMHKRKGPSGFAYTLADRMSGGAYGKTDAESGSVTLIAAVVAWYVGGRGKLLEHTDLKPDVARLVNEHVLFPCGKPQLGEYRWTRNDPVQRKLEATTEYVLRVDYELREGCFNLCLSFQ